MSALTLHAMDDRLVIALRRYASELGTSLNQAAKTLIASALVRNVPVCTFDPHFRRVPLLQVLFAEA